MFLYPWGDMHSLNLGWFLLQFKDWVEKIQEYLDNGGGTSENLANVIAPVFNAANSYQSGDYVLYNNELYKANQAVAPGTWNHDAWDNCLIVDEMGSGGGAGVDNVARLMIAGEYSASFGYQKYAICRYNDKLWMCNTNLPSGGEAWNPAHWDEITVGAGLTGLRRSVETLAEDIIELNGAIHSIGDISMFEKIGIIGDSFASGENYYSSSFHDNYNISWGQVIARDAGISVINYSKGGYTVAQFLDSSDAAYNIYGYGKVVSDATANKNRVGLFIIALGLNDANSDQSGANVNTFKTNLSTVIDNINTLYSNGAKIILITFVRNSYVEVASDAAYNNAIKEVATTKSLPLIDLSSLPFFNTTEYLNSFDASGHPNPQIYSAMATAIKQAVNTLLVSNAYRDYFKNYYGLNVNRHIVKDGTFTPSAEMPASFTYQLTKIDNIVQFGFDSGATLITRTSNGWITIGTLPPGFIPESQVNSIGYYTKANTEYIRNVQILNNGTVRVYWNLQAGAESATLNFIVTGCAFAVKTE